MTALGEVAPPTSRRGRHRRPPNGAARRSHGAVQRAMPQYDYVILESSFNR